MFLELAERVAHGEPVERVAEALQEAAKRKREAPPVCKFCGRSGNGVQFAMFNPRFKPFGTACTDCEKSLPPGTEPPVGKKE